MRDIGILAADSVARRINRESFLLLGGTAALLMQVAHPLVAAGVDQHSDFRRSPLRRLVRTVNTTLAAVYGERAIAQGALKRIGRSHAPVRGQAADGRAYRARDPELMLWVQATLVLTSMRWYEAVMGGLADAERDAYWAEGKFFAGELGVPRDLFPATYADLERYEAKMLATAVVPDPTGAAVAHDVVRPYSWLPAIAYWPTDALSAALLPSPLRDAFGFRFGISQRMFYRAVIVAIRALRPLLPEWITVVPQARRFEKAMSERRGAA
ncbi:MAG: oxygenase MpaB family protein [Chloroflexota bacterium]